MLFNKISIITIKTKRKAKWYDFNVKLMFENYLTMFVVVDMFAIFLIMFDVGWNSCKYLKHLLDVFGFI